MNQTVRFTTLVNRGFIYNKRYNDDKSNTKKMEIKKKKCHTNTHTYTCRVSGSVMREKYTHYGENNTQNNEYATLQYISN